MKKFNKKVVILDHEGGGRLANQLWSYISIYAYCLEQGYKCANPSFFPYKKYFNLPRKIDLIYISYRISKRVGHKIYGIYKNAIKIMFPKKIINSGNALKFNGVFYLPPSNVKSEHDKKEIEKIESESYKKIYTTGWLFRNPIGIIKHRQKLIASFSPKKNTTDKIKKFIESLRADYNEIIGIHIRQGDYKTFDQGQLFFEQKKIKKIMDDFLVAFNKDRRKVIFVICSDDDVDEAIFSGLNIKVNRGSTVEDLFILSATDLIIGSNSTFGAFASYYGDIPFIIFEKKINWDFYKNKREYFENKKCTKVCY